MVRPSPNYIKLWAVPSPQKNPAPKNILRSVRQQKKNIGPRGVKETALGLRLLFASFSHGPVEVNPSWMGCRSGPKGGKLTTAITIGY